MHRTMARVLAVALVVATAGDLARADSRSTPAARAVAFTFDDLPASRFRTLADLRAINTRLLGQIRKLEIPAIGFVNEMKLAAAGEVRERETLLEAWLEAGLELGNHTYSHVRLSNVPLADYQADVLNGERATRRLMTAHGRTLRYFRHPTLNTGPDLATKRAFERFLAEHGYTIAPVTIDSDEYLYALAFDRARARGDQAAADRLVTDYLRYMEEMTAWCERFSLQLVGREPAQVLLLHANWLNAECLDRLAAMFRRRGYRFVTLEDALADPAYALPDDYIGERGPSWLERWAITRGVSPPPTPELPDWVQAATR